MGKTGEMKIESTSGDGKVETVMHEFKMGDLYSSSGKKVKKKDQAIAIALSEKRRAGKR